MSKRARGGGRPLLWAASAAWVLALACAAPVAERPVLGPGTRLRDLPAGYALILGRVSVSVDGATVVCPPSAGTAVCGLALRKLGGGTFQVPHQSYPASLDLAGDREPFFVLRLPAGTYEAERFEASVQEVPERFNGRSGNSVAVKRRFSVKAGEVVYVGSLMIDLPAADTKRATVRVVEEADRARAVAEEVDPEAGRRVVLRPMR